MAIKNDREYRNIGLFEKREAVEGNEDSYKVAGYASTFAEYLLFSWDGEDYYERIDEHAFDDADMSDVVFLRDHEGRVFARTKNGTLKLSVDGHGLYTETDLKSTSASREMFEDIDCGLYSQMSFAFTVEDDEVEEMEGGGFLRRIKKIRKVYDVSAVSFPANPTTDIGVSARSAFDGAIEQRTAERLAAEAQRLKREKLKLKLKLMED